MAVELQRVSFDDAKLQTFQQYVADAVAALSEQRSAVGVLPISASRKLVGNEDFVLVDASTATDEITLVLPSPKLVQRQLTIRVTKAGSQAVRVKAVDIPSTGSANIDGSASVAIPAGATTSLRIISDGRNFSTV